MQPEEEVVWTPEGYVALVGGQLVSIPYQRLYDLESVTNAELWMFTHLTRWGAMWTLRKRRKKVKKVESRKKSLDILRTL